MSSLIQARPAPQPAHEAHAHRTPHNGGEDAPAAGIVDRAVAEGVVRSTAIEIAQAQAGKAGDTLGTIKARVYAPAMAVLRDRSRPLRQAVRSGSPLRSGMGRAITATVRPTRTSRRSHAALYPRREFRPGHVAGLMSTTPRAGTHHERQAFAVTQARTLTARATTRPRISRETRDCTPMAILAQGAMGMTSVGLKAVALVSAR